MNEPESDLQSGSNAALEEKCAELQRVTNMMFAGLIITSFTLTAYLAIQGRRAAQDAAAAKLRANEAMRLVDQDDATIRTFYSKLEEFARTHPDFQKRVLSNYKITSTNASAGK